MSVYKTQILHNNNNTTREVELIVEQQMFKFTPKHMKNISPQTCKIKTHIIKSPLHSTSPGQSLRKDNPQSMREG